MKTGKRPVCCRACPRRRHAAVRAYLAALNAARLAAAAILLLPEPADDRAAMEAAQLREDVTAAVWMLNAAESAVESAALPCCLPDALIALTPA